MDIDWTDNFRFIPESDDIEERNLSMLQLDFQHHDFQELLSAVWNEHHDKYPSPTEAFVNHIDIVLTSQTCRTCKHFESKEALDKDGVCHLLGEKDSGLFAERGNVHVDEDFGCKCHID